MPNQQQLETALHQFIDPYLAVSWSEAKAAIKITASDPSTQIDITLGYPCNSVKQDLQNQVAAYLQKSFTNTKFDIKIHTCIQRHRISPRTKPVEQIKNIIAVASGKGGVGKSTVSANLALALQSEGAKTGILDADIYGPSQPHMLGSYDTPDLTNKKLQPLALHGLQTMSIGNLVDSDKAMIWRGPMVSQALQQLMNDTQWQDLDYLIIDLPPGTGDIQLTLSQKIPVTAAIIVTTPQDLSLIDAKRAIAMFNKVNIPVLGIIENMSAHTCSQCGHVEPIFGEGGGKHIANRFEIDLLGQLPLDIKIRQDADKGNPTVAQSPDTNISKQFKEIARKAAAKMSLLNKGYSLKLTEVKTESE